MKNGKSGNILVIIEKGKLREICLDEKESWEVGRPTADNIPDIALDSKTVSRKHGRFINMDGVWFYIDCNGKNGTVYNKKHINAGLNGRIKPAMLSDGDVFVFGGGDKEYFTEKTIFALFLTGKSADEWKEIDAEGCSEFIIRSQEIGKEYSEPAKGTVVELDNAVVIFMGDTIYTNGDVSVSFK